MMSQNQMNRVKLKLILKITLLLGTLVSLFYVPWILVWAWILPLPDTVQEQVDDAINFGFVGMIVYIDQSNKQPKYYTGGFDNKENKTPANPNSLFKIGSISKLYVALTIAKLANEGRLSLDYTLCKYLPELKNLPIK